MNSTLSTINYKEQFQTAIIVLIKTVHKESYYQCISQLNDWIALKDFISKIENFKLHRTLIAPLSYFETEAIIQNWKTVIFSAQSYFQNFSRHYPQGYIDLSKVLNERQEMIKLMILLMSIISMTDNYKWFVKIMNQIELECKQAHKQIRTLFSISFELGLQKQDNVFIQKNIAFISNLQKENYLLNLEREVLIEENTILKTQLIQLKDQLNLMNQQNFNQSGNKSIRLSLRDMEIQKLKDQNQKLKYMYRIGINKLEDQLEKQKNQIKNKNSIIKHYEYFRDKCQSITTLKQRILFLENVIQEKNSQLINIKKMFEKEKNDVQKMKLLLKKETVQKQGLEKRLLQIQQMLHSAKRFHMSTPKISPKSLQKTTMHDQLAICLQKMQLENKRLKKKLDLSPQNKIKNTTSEILESFCNTNKEKAKTNFTNNYELLQKNNSANKENYKINFTNSHEVHQKNNSMKFYKSKGKQVVIMFETQLEYNNWLQQKEIISLSKAHKLHQQQLEMLFQLLVQSYDRIQQLRIQKLNKLRQ